VKLVKLLAACVSARGRHLEHKL